jgi:hypothetical protein
LTKWVWHAQVAVKTIKSVKLQHYWRRGFQVDGVDLGAFGRRLVFRRMSFDEPRRRVTSVIPHTYPIGCPLHCRSNGGIAHVSGQLRAHSCDDFLFRAPDYRRQDGSDEIVRGEQPRRIAGGIGCRAAPHALTKVARFNAL